MSTNIKQLIDELFPNGVEWKTLGEVCEFKRGNAITKDKTISGNIPVVAGGRKLAYYHNEYNRTGETIVVAGSGAYAGYISFWNEPIFVSDAFSVHPDKNLLIIKYVYYFLLTKQEIIHSLKTGAGVSHVYPKDLQNFRVPIPPLPVQEEIVRILDKFTADVNEHIQLLERELELRHKQYEYYRNKLLTPTEENGSWLLNGHSVEWKTLGEVCDVTSGGTPSKSKKEYWENGIIPWLKSEVCNNTSIYSASDFITELGLKNSSTKLLEKNITLMAMVGATRFKTAFWEFEAYTNQNIASINSKIKNKLSNKFIFYYLTNKYDEFRKKMSSYGMINLETIRSINIPIPPMEEQERIVGILDKFNKLINDLSIGLPAEIQARKKQYEYYRNKLLTFKEKDS
ncbi:MAG TPA: restriction endonuclease subunit S [Ignavibacteriales bacterium]|nr:restriction endonuclease subunit S [Ignavibacteriales bacterium]